MRSGITSMRSESKDWKKMKVFGNKKTTEPKQDITKISIDNIKTQKQISSVCTMSSLITLIPSMSIEKQNKSLGGRKPKGLISKFLL